MPENNPTPNAELAELRRLHERIQRFTSPDEELSAGLSFIDAFPGLLARLEAAERERGELEAELEEARANSIEYEKDCTKALCSLAREFDYEWDGDGATADDLREFISETLRNALERAVAMQNDRDGAVYAMIVSGCQIDAKALAARDAQQRREGAAQVWDQIARITAHVTDGFIRVSKGYAEEQAESLREGGE